MKKFKKTIFELAGSFLGFLFIGVLGGRFFELLLESIKPNIFGKNEEYFLILLRLLALALTLFLLHYLFLYPFKVALWLFFITSTLYGFWACWAIKKGLSGTIGVFFMQIHILVLVSAPIIIRISMY